MILDLVANFNNIDKVEHFSSTVEAAKYNHLKHKN